MLMNMGVLMLVGSGALAVRFRPRGRTGRRLCVLVGFMGLTALLAGPGGLFFQVTEVLLQVAAALCCVRELRREQRFRRRRSAFVRVCHCANRRGVHPPQAKAG